MTAAELAEAIARWVGQHAERESDFLTPVPVWSVDAHALLDHIAETTGIAKERLGEWAGTSA